MKALLPYRSNKIHKCASIGTHSDLKDKENITGSAI